MSRTIRASEIGSYLFCHKAWKYQRQDVKSENVTEMLSGTSLHHAHGRSVIETGFTRVLSIVFLIFSVIAFVLHLLSQEI